MSFHLISGKSKFEGYHTSLAMDDDADEDDEVMGAPQVRQSYPMCSQTSRDLQKCDDCSWFLTPIFSALIVFLLIAFILWKMEF